jgi:hypothetical protein
VYALGVISVAALAFVGTVIYEIVKADDHRKIITSFLKMEREIKKLESLKNAAN